MFHNGARPAHLTWPGGCAARKFKIAIELEFPFSVRDPNAFFSDRSSFFSHPTFRRPPSHHAPRTTIFCQRQAQDGSYCQQRLATGESLRSICRDYTIQPNQLRDWKRDIQKLSRAQKNKKSLHKGREGYLRKFEEPIVEWILDMREQGFPLSYRNIILKAKEVGDDAFCQLGFTQQYNVVRRLCMKNSVTIRRVTHTSQADSKEPYR